MSGLDGFPRLLFPSTEDEAHLELRRIGSDGPWLGPLGGPPRVPGVPLPGSFSIAFRIPAPLLDLALRLSLPAGLTLYGSPGGPGILAGPLDGVAGLLEGLTGEESACARRALAAGAGRTAPAAWEFAGGRLGLEEGVRLMAVVNRTPDSFYEGSRTPGENDLLRRLDEVVEEGADLLDIGGESTRPGAEPVPDAEQIDRVVPAIEAARARTGLPVSVDTTRGAVARAAVAGGAVIINDISAGQDDPGMFDLAASSGVGLVLMHRKGASATMQEDPYYDDLVGEIHAYLGERTEAAIGAGVDADRIAVDPGLGFGKRRQHNFELYRRMAEFHALGYPLLVGPSRKRHTSGPSDRPASERLMGTAAACALLACQGVQILRVHDVGAMRRVLETADEIRGAIIEDRVS